MGSNLDVYIINAPIDTMGAFHFSLWSQGGMFMKKHLYLMIITALGTAMFFVIGKFLAIPTPIPNFALFLQYAVLIVFSFYFGPTVGFGIGFLGHFLIDLLSGYGLWFSWIMSSAVFGLLVGLTSYLINKRPNPYKISEMLLFILFTTLSGALCWGLIAPSGDIFIYQEPIDVVWVEGVIAFASNVVSSLLIGIPIIYGLRRVRIPYSIANKEENTNASM